jgi:hypothetical protein
MARTPIPKIKSALKRKNKVEYGKEKAVDFSFM